MPACHCGRYRATLLGLSAWVYVNLGAFVSTKAAPFCRFHISRYHGRLYRLLPDRDVLRSSFTITTAWQDQGRDPAWILKLSMSHASCEAVLPNFEVD